MPTNWFRRLIKSGQEHEAEAPAAPDVEPEQPAPSPPEAESPEAPRKKRRRGSRGGRGRKKKTDAEPVADPVPVAEKKKKKPEEPARKKEPTRGRRQPRRKEPVRRPQLPAAKRELVVSVDVGEQRVAVLEDDRVAEVYLERPERRSIAGNIYLGTVDNVLPGMEAAFVEIGLDKNGFLYVDEIVVPELEGKGQGRKIQDLIQRGQKILVQAVKDPMKTKGARLTTEISLPGRFVVFVPHGEGTGVSRRLDDDERTRLKEILRNLDLPEGGVIVRTAAEGASAEDIERDLVFLQRLWKSIVQRAEELEPPALVYQEAELPLRVVRDLFTGDFERALVDDERTYKRIVGYLKKTSPHMVERVVRHKDKTPLMEAHGVEAEIRSTLSRRVDLPSGGYLIFDYAEAFTVIDVNTGRFVGSRSKSSGARLEDTITKNNLEAVTEVVRQLRLRDIGGIIVIDFIDMANPKNRATVEEALRKELERDRTKTYVVEISPLGLVEMTRQNVTEGPREILTERCPICSGDGIVVSHETAAVELERRLRSLAGGSRAKAFRVEVSAHVGAALIGPGASRLAAIEERTKKRFFIELREDAEAEHFVVLEEGTLEALAGERPVEEGAELQLKLVEVGLHDPSAGVGKLDGYQVCVADAAKLVGKKVKVRIARVLDGTAYGSLVGAEAPRPPITAESEAEKPTRRPPARKAPAKAKPAEPVAEPEEAAAEKPTRRPPARKAAAKAKPKASEPVAEPAEAAAEEPTAEETPRKKTRRGSRGGRGRKRKTAAAAGAAQTAEDGAGPRIHVPDPSLGAEPEPEPEPAVADASSVPATDGDQPAAPRKRTRRGSRGGRGRRRKASEASAEATAEKK